jgi:hypothetical protein
MSQLEPYRRIKLNTTDASTAAAAAALHQSRSGSSLHVHNPHRSSGSSAGNSASSASAVSDRKRVKTTEFSLQIALPERIVVKEVEVTILEPRGKFVKAIRVNYNTRDVDFAHFESGAADWVYCGTIQVAKGETSVKLSFQAAKTVRSGIRDVSLGSSQQAATLSKSAAAAVVTKGGVKEVQTGSGDFPIVAHMLRFDYSEFWDSNHPSASAGNRGSGDGVISCPRCSRSVSNAHGVCGNCGEVAFQCRKCRHINYDRLDAFLCVECGYCASGFFTYHAVAARASRAVAISDESSRRKAEEDLRFVEDVSREARAALSFLRADCERVASELMRTNIGGVVHGYARDIIASGDAISNYSDSAQALSAGRTSRPGSAFSEANVGAILGGGSGSAAVSSSREARREEKREHKRRVAVAEATAGISASAGNSGGGTAAGSSSGSKRRRRGAIVAAAGSALPTAAALASNTASAAAAAVDVRNFSHFPEHLQQALLGNSSSLMNNSNAAAMSSSGGNSSLLPQRSSRGGDSASANSALVSGSSSSSSRLLHLSSEDILGLVSGSSAYESGEGSNPLLGGGSGVPPPESVQNLINLARQLRGESGGGAGGAGGARAGGGHLGLIDIDDNDFLNSIAGGGGAAELARVGGSGSSRLLGARAGAAGGSGLSSDYLSRLVASIQSRVNSRMESERGEGASGGASTAGGATGGAGAPRRQPAPPVIAISNRPAPPSAEVVATVAAASSSSSSSSRSRSRRREVAVAGGGGNVPSGWGGALEAGDAKRRKLLDGSSRSSNAPCVDDFKKLFAEATNLFYTLATAKIETRDLKLRIRRWDRVIAPDEDDDDNDDEMMEDGDTDDSSVDVVNDTDDDRSSDNNSKRRLAAVVDAAAAAQTRRPQQMKNMPLMMKEAVISCGGGSGGGCAECSACNADVERNWLSLLFTAVKLGGKCEESVQARVVQYVIERRGDEAAEEREREEGSRSSKGEKREVNYLVKALVELWGGALKKELMKHFAILKCISGENAEAILRGPITVLSELLLLESSSSSSGERSEWSERSEGSTEEDSYGFVALALAVLEEENTTDGIRLPLLQALNERIVALDSKQL